MSLSSLFIISLFCTLITFCDSKTFVKQTLYYKKGCQTIPTAVYFRESGRCLSMYSYTCQGTSISGENCGSVGQAANATYLVGCQDDPSCMIHFCSLTD